VTKYSSGPAIVTGVQYVTLCYASIGYSQCKLVYSLLDAVCCLLYGSRK